MKSSFYGPIVECMDCPSSHLGPPDPGRIFLTDLRWKMWGYVVTSQALANILHGLFPLLGVRPSSSSPGSMVQEPVGGSSSWSWFLRPTLVASGVQIILKESPLLKAPQHCPSASEGQLRLNHKNPTQEAQPHQLLANGVSVWVLARSCYKICLKPRLSFLNLCRHISICMEVFTGYWKGEGKP